MKTIPLRKSYSGLLILVAVIITIVTIGFMFNLYRIYTAGLQRVHRGSQPICRDCQLQAGRD